jgi:hypothetical protein
LDKTAVIWNQREALPVLCTTGGWLFLWMIEKLGIVLRQQCSTRFEPRYARLARSKRQVQLRDSRHPGKSSGSRLASTDAEDALVIGMSERVYESTKLAALFDVLIGQGHPAREILRNINLQEDVVHTPKARISLAELMTACKNAILSSDRHLPYRIGALRHVRVCHSMLPRL